MDTIYFDNAATTPIKTEVLNEMIPYLTKEYGNASSLYTIGRNAKRAIENARKQVAELINCKPNEIFFTGSGSESDNTAIKGYAYANKEKALQYCKKYAQDMDNAVMSSHIDLYVNKYSLDLTPAVDAISTLLNVDSSVFV